MADALAETTSRGAVAGSTTAVNTSARPVNVNEGLLRAQIHALLPEVDIAHTSVGYFREALEKSLGFKDGSLKAQDILIRNTIHEEFANKHKSQSQKTQLVLADLEVEAELEDGWKETWKCRLPSQEPLRELAKLWAVAHMPIPDAAVGFDTFLDGRWQDLNLHDLPPAALGWKAKKRPVRFRAYPVDAHYATVMPSPSFRKTPPRLKEEQPQKRVRQNGGGEDPLQKRTNSKTLGGACVGSQEELRPCAPGSTPAATAPPVDVAPVSASSMVVAAEPTATAASAHTDVPVAKLVVAAEPTARAASAHTDVSIAKLVGDECVEFVQKNPKKAGSAAWQRYERYKVAKTTKQALSLGAAMGELMNDLKKGNMTVKK